jgi:hypothetical protein
MISCFVKKMIGIIVNWDQSLFPAEESLSGWKKSWSALASVDSREKSRRTFHEPESLLSQWLEKAKLSAGLASPQLGFQSTLNCVTSKFPQRIRRNPSRRWGFEGMDLSGSLDGK